MLYLNLYMAFLRQGDAVQHGNCGAAIILRAYKAPAAQRKDGLE